MRRAAITTAFALVGSNAFTPQSPGAWTGRKSVVTKVLESEKATSGFAADETETKDFSAAISEVAAVQENARYKAVTASSLDKVVERHPRLAEHLEDIKLSALVFPFKASPYLVDELINWEAEDLRKDPMYALVMPTLEMLSPSNREKLIEAKKGGDPMKLIDTVAEIREELNPHPAGQKTLNAPKEEKLTGVQHKYSETALVFPAAAQTCHAYCTYCFRWAQFIGDDELRFAQKEAAGFFEYLDEHKEISDVLMTGGDPMVMRTNSLAQYLEPFTDPNFLPHIRNLRIGTRSLTFWPQRFTTDKDADACIELLRRVREEGGRHIAIMAHLSHEVELSTDKVKAAINRLQKEAYVIIRSQSPVMGGINDDPRIWSNKWKKEVNMGIVPYYLFVARDTGAREFFDVPLVKAHMIYSDAIRGVSGLHRTARGPSMSCTPGKVELSGIVDLPDGTRAMSFRFLQCRDAAWIGRPFLTKYDENAVWFDDLEPLDGQELPWDERGLPRPIPENAYSYHNLE